MSSSSTTWSNEDQLVRTEYVIRTCIANRRDICNDPRLVAHSGNYGNKINQKLQQMLKKFEAGVSGAEGMTAAAVGSKKSAIGPAAGSGAGDGGSPKKTKVKSGGWGSGQSAGGTPKKRKIKEEVTEDEAVDSE